MALEEKTEYDFELRSKWNVQVRKHNIILKDGKEVARTYERYVLRPFYPLQKIVKESGLM